MQLAHRLRYTAMKIEKSPQDHHVSASNSVVFSHEKTGSRARELQSGTSTYRSDSVHVFPSVDLLWAIQGEQVKNNLIRATLANQGPFGELER